MKLQENDYGFEAVLPEERIAFTIENSAKLFGILSSGIYKDKILAVIRELSCNAYDAHIDGKKKHVPFKLRLPTRLDPVFYVEDEGTGIDPTQIGKIYWTYGRSSKTDSNDQIGALGLGSKSPFAYTQSSFVVKNRYNGREYTYLCFINEEGKPDGSKVSEEPTDKPSGVTVEFAVRLEDINAFYDRTSRFFKRWSATLPIFVDQDAKSIVKPVLKVVEGTDWYLEKASSEYTDHKGAVALQGNVPYPIELGSIPKLSTDLVIIASNPFIITFDMGEINFAASREALQYDERTCNNITARLQEVRQELEQSFKDKVFKKGMTHLEFITRFRKTFIEFKSTISYAGVAFGSDVDNWYSKLLLGKQKNDVVVYDSINWSIEQLISGTITLKSFGHQCFGIYKVERRKTHSARMFMKQFTLVAYAATNDIPGDTIHTSWLPGSLIHAGEKFCFDWKSASVSTRARHKDTYFKVIQNAHLFSAKTVNTLPITSAITFFVNDVGSSGEARYKVLSNYEPGFFVNFDHKTTSVDEVVKQLNSLIDNGLKGAKIELISDHPDHRPPIEKEKTEIGTTKLKFIKMCFNDDDEFVTTRKKEEIVKIADLQAEPVVMYVVKRRSPTMIYDDFNDAYSIINSKDIMSLAAKYVFPELMVQDVQHKFVKLLIINEGQFAWLKKRKINLVSLRDLITDRIVAMEEYEKFCEKIEESRVFQSITVLDSLYLPSIMHRLTDISTMPSVFKEYFIKFTNIKNSVDDLAESYEKMQILSEVKVGHSSRFIGDKAEEIKNTIDKKYPLLHMLQSNKLGDRQNAMEVVNYIEQIDAKDL